MKWNNRDIERSKEMKEELDSLFLIFSLLDNLSEEYQDSIDTSEESKLFYQSRSVHKPAILRILDVISTVLLVICLFQLLFS